VPRSDLVRGGVHPRNAQALARLRQGYAGQARHSTIDLTMGVYTHVAMADLHDDVESPPGMAPEGSKPEAAEGDGAPGDMPSDLAGLICSWSDLPENIRSAISSLGIGR